MAAIAAEAAGGKAVSSEIGTAVRHSVIYGIGSILIKAIGFLLLPFYTHYLSPRDYGMIEVLDVSMSFMGMFLNMGITAALLRFYGAAKTEQERREVVGTVFAFAVCTGVLILGLGFAVVPAASRLLLGPDVPKIYFTLSYIAFVLGYVGNIPFAYLRAKEYSGKVVLIDTLGTLGILVLNIVLLGGFKMAVLGMLLGPLLVSVVKLGVCIHWMSGGMTMGIKWHLLKRILRFGAPLVFSNLALFTLNFSDRFFLQRLTSLEIVGIYAIGYKFGYLLNFILIQPFNMMWQARMYVVQERPDHRQVFEQVFSLYSLVLIFAALGLSLMGKEVIRIMVDPRFVAGAQIVGVVTLAYVFLGISYYVQLSMFLEHRTELVGAISTVAGIVNVAANYYFISRYGMMGAAVATLLAFFVLAVGCYLGSERVSPMGLPIGRVSLVLGIAIAVYFAGQKFAPLSVFRAIAFKFLLLAGFAVIVRLWLLSRAEIATIETLCQSAIQKVARYFKPGPEPSIRSAS